MTSVDLAGLGVWGESFSNWEQFCRVARGESVDENVKLQPELIPARERRRAPLFVKMAVEVMDQACRMAAVDRSSAATILASGMGDMQITDYMCRTLATMPSTISPTKFHNSVHNAATGYWSIATASHSPASAVSGYDHSAAVALLEGAIQAIEEDIPVLVAIQEMAAPAPFKSVYGGAQPFATALLLTRKGYCASPIGQLSFKILPGEPSSDVTTRVDGVNLTGNFAADLIDLLLAVASHSDSGINLQLSDSAALSVALVLSESRGRAHG